MHITVTLRIYKNEDISDLLDLWQGPGICKFSCGGIFSREWVKVWVDG
jgi:hypothetical protein